MVKLAKVLDLLDIGLPLAECLLLVLSSRRNPEHQIAYF